MRITGITSADYFVIKCEKCGSATENEYLGGDPGVPHFKAKCKKCNTETDLKLSAANWKGLPYKI